MSEMEREVRANHRLRFWVMALALALAASISDGLIRAFELQGQVAELKARCVDPGR